MALGGGFVVGRLETAGRSLEDHPNRLAGHVGEVLEERVQFARLEVVEQRPNGKPRSPEAQGAADPVGTAPHGLLKRHGPIVTHFGTDAPAAAARPIEEPVCW